MKQKKALVVVTIVLSLVLSLCFISLSLYFLTWGFPWELSKAKEIASQYLKGTYTTPMEVLSANRFSRGIFRVFAQNINNPHVVFTVELTSDYDVLWDDFYDQQFKYFLEQDLQAKLDEVYPGTSVSVAFDSALQLYKNPNVSEHTDFQKMLTYVNDKYRCYIYIPDSLTADSYTYSLDSLHRIIVAFQQYPYTADVISIYPLGYMKATARANGEDPSIVLQLKQKEYNEIHMPDGLLPYIADAIKDNPYYST